MYSVEIYVCIFLIQMLAFTVKGVAGFGEPLISNPLLMSFMDNRQITPMNLCIQLPVNAYMAVKKRKNFSVKRVLPTTIAVLFGTVPGALLLANASALWLKLVLGLIIIGLSVEMATRTRAKPTTFNKYKMMVISFVSGICGGIFGINLFFVAYLERTINNRDEFRGSICFVFLFENIFRFILYIAMGIITNQIFTLVVACLPGVVAGMILAKILDKKLSDRLIKITVIVMFFIGGISTVITTIAQM